MDILFKNSALKKKCTKGKDRIKAYGPNCAKRLGQRLDDLDAAESLEEFRYLPGRCHELHGSRAGTFALDLEHPFRLVFEPTEDPPPQKPDGGIDWSGVTSVRILSVEDYHGKK